MRNFTVLMQVEGVDVSVFVKLDYEDRIGLMRIDAHLLAVQALQSKFVLAIEGGERSLVKLGEVTSIFDCQHARAISILNNLSADSIDVFNIYEECREVA